MYFTICNYISIRGKSCICAYSKVILSSVYVLGQLLFFFHTETKTQLQSNAVYLKDLLGTGLLEFKNPTRQHAPIY